MILRATTVATLLLASVIALTGCLAPAPEPTPTPTAVFESEEEAFAAAEETYRAYVEALNEVNLDEPSTFEPLFALTTGALNAETRKTFSQMHADGWTVSGPTLAPVVEARVAEPGNLSVLEVAVCQDVSDVAVIDAEGQSVVSPDRPDMQSMLATLVADMDSPTGYLIESIKGREGEPQCG